MAEGGRVLDASEQPVVDTIARANRLGGRGTGVYILGSTASDENGGRLAYKKPILTEIYAEIFFEPGSIKAEDFFSIVPKFMEFGFSDVEFADAGVRLSVDPSAPEAVVAQPKTRVRCWRPGRSSLMQVAEDKIAANLVGDYPGWNRFVELFDELLASARAGMPDANPVSLSLTTIDRFTVPSAGFRLGDYVQAGGRYVPAWLTDAGSNLDVSLGHGFLEKDGFNRKLNLRLRIEGETAVAHFRATFHDRLEGRDPAEVLEGLHTESTATFESIVTDRVREEVMGGIA